MLIQADLTDPDEVARAVAAATRVGRAIVGLVNSVGAVNRRPHWSSTMPPGSPVSARRWDVSGQPEVAKRMATGGGGSIVNIGVGGDVLWLAGAAGLRRRKRRDRCDDAHARCRVGRPRHPGDCVAPGYVDSKLVADLIERDVIDGETYRNLHALKRFGAPREVADVILFLLSTRPPT